MKLLMAKHWQLFVLTFALPLFFYLIAVFSFVFRMISLSQEFQSNKPIQLDPADFIAPIICLAISFCCGMIMYVWIYSAATKLQEFMHPEMRKLKLNRFRIFFFSPFVYIILFMIISPVVALNIQSPGLIAVLIVTIVLGHLFTGFCIIYTLYFTAKTIKSAQLQREAHFSDYIGEFFLIWFYPIGIWFVQPVVNKIVGAVESSK